MVTEFHVVKNLDGDPEPCQCCGCEDDVPTALFDRGPPTRGKVRLCEICASTNIGSAQEFGAHRESWVTLQAIAQVGNLLLKEIRSNGRNR